MCFRFVGRKKIRVVICLRIFMTHTNNRQLKAVTFVKEKITNNEYQELWGIYFVG